MTYSSGGLIQATDFNGFAGTTGVGSAATINQIWNIGTGDCGYGQTTIATVSAGATVAATNWAALINTLNSIRTHQSGSGSGISAPSAGSTVTYLSTLGTAISTAYSSRTTAATNGTTTSSTKNITMSAAASASVTGTATFTLTFGSGVDATRYFFNAGGRLRFYYSSFTNTGGTSRGTSIQTLAQTNWASKIMGSTSYDARTGTGGTIVTDATAGGYYTGINATPTEKFRVNSTSYYTGDYLYLNFSTNGTAGSYSANGNILTVTIGAFSATTGSTQPPDSINITLGVGVDVVYPETTNLTDTWGTVTIA
jgi:hypothetical protein